MADIRLREAWQQGDEKQIVAAIDAGGNPNLRMDGTPLLMSASMAGAVPAVRALLRAGVDVDARNENEGATALMYSAGLGYKPEHAEITLLLLEHGADVNARDARGNTALDRAIGFNNLDMANLLSGRGGKCKRAASRTFERMRERNRREGGSAER